MGYLNNQIVTVDAILTKKGRELLARGDGSFRITQFALADDEIDYSLYNPDHEDGETFFGQAIENLPIIEAMPDESRVMKSKLVTLPRGTSRIPQVSIGRTTISLNQGETLVIRPETFNFQGNTSIFETSGYVATVADARLLRSITGAGIATEEVQRLNQTQSIGTIVSRTVIGSTFTLVATALSDLFGINETTIVTTLTVFGRDSGAQITVPLRINKTN